MLLHLLAGFILKTEDTHCQKITSPLTLDFTDSRMCAFFQIPFSFAIELWGEGDYTGAKCFDLFNPRSEMLKVNYP